MRLIDRNSSGDPGVSHGEEEASEDQSRLLPQLKTNDKEQNVPQMYLSSLGGLSSLCQAQANEAVLHKTGS